MPSYKWDFNSCAIRDGFCKSSHNYDLIKCKYHYIAMYAYWYCFDQVIKVGISMWLKSITEKYRKIINYLCNLCVICTCIYKCF